MADDAEYVDLIFREIGKEDAKRAAKEVSDAVSKMTDAEKDAAREAGRAAAQQRQAMDDVRRAANESRSSIENIGKAFTPLRRSMELLSNVRGALSLVTSAALAAVAAIRSMAERVPMAQAEIEQLESASANLFTQFSEGFVVSTNLTMSIDRLGDTCDLAGSDARRLGTALGTVWEVAGPLVSLLPQLGSISAGLLARTTYEGVPDLDIIPIEGGGYQRAMPTSIALAEGEAAAQEVARRQRREAALAAGQRLRESLNSGSRGGGGGGRERPREYLTNEGLLEELEFRAIAAAAEHLYDDISGYQDAELEGIEANQEAQLESIRAQSAAWAELNEQRRQEAEFQAELIESEKAQRLELVENMRSQAMQSAEAIGSAFNSTAGIMGQLAQREQQQIDNITSALEASGATQEQIERATKAHQDRLDTLAKVEGGFLIAYNAVMAATETAEAIRSGARYEFGAMAEHIASAASFAAAAVMAGVRLGDDGSGGGVAMPAPATADYVPDRGNPGDDLGQPSGAYVQIFTMGGTSARLGQEMNRATRELQASGLDSPMLGGGGWSQ